jgi:hypothetical protein
MDRGLVLRARADRFVPGDAEHQAAGVMASQR